MRNRVFVRVWLMVLGVALVGCAFSGCGMGRPTFPAHDGGGARDGWQYLESQPHAVPEPMNPRKAEDPHEDRKLLTIFILLMVPLALLLMTGRLPWPLYLCGFVVTSVLFCWFSVFSLLLFLFLPLGCVPFGVRLEPRGGGVPSYRAVPSAYSSRATCSPARPCMPSSAAPGRPRVPSSPSRQTVYPSRTLPRRGKGSRDNRGYHQ